MHIQKDQELSGIHALTYEQLMEKFDNKDKFVLYISRSDCGDCIEFAPVLEDYLSENEGTYVYYVDVNELKISAFADDASEEEVAFFDNIRTELSYQWTPTLHLYEGREVMSSYSYLDEEFYDIEDEAEQDQRRQEFVDQFQTWMNDIYE